MSNITFITSLAEAGAKYCDEHVCLSVCLSVRQHISGITLVVFTNFSVHVAYGRGLVLLRQSDNIPRGRGSLRGFPPNRQYMYRLRCKWRPAAEGIIPSREAGDGSP